MPIAPPRAPGPPLNALRAFEAAARHGGFRAAAEELGVTPGAVAQQIKSLEAWTSAPLFERRAQGVALSALGLKAAAGYAAAFDALGAANQTLRGLAAPNAVRIAALPSVAQLWLSPRLPAIRRAAPDLEISITAMEQPPHLGREMFDLSIFFGPTPGAVDEIDLGADEIFPVASPSVAAGLVERDLDRETLLSDAAWDGDWSRWLGRPAATGPQFSLYSLAIEAAKTGAGILIGHRHLVAAEIALGELVAPFGRTISLSRRLTLATAQPREAAEQVARLLTMDGAATSEDP